MPPTSTALRPRQVSDGRPTRVFRWLTKSGATTEGDTNPFWVVLARSGLAVGLTAVTVYAMRRIEDADDLTAVPFATITLLALASTALCGVYLGIAATILACAGATYFVIPPYGSFSVTDQSQWFRLLMSAVVSLIVAVLYEQRRRQSRSARELSRQLAEANRTKDEFIGQVSHELRTPLTIIVGNASILLREHDQLDKAARQETLTDIVASGERLQHMIQNLLALARAEANVEEPDEPIMVHHAVRDLIDSHRRRQPERQINLLVSGELTPVICPRESLEQVVENLLTNAEKYSPADKPIDVRVQIGPDALVISIADRGPGFGRANVTELFEPFVRSDSARLAAPGLGIGLSVAHRLVQAHGGRIWAQNREGGGAEVTFSLPALVVAIEADEVMNAHVAGGRTAREGNESPLTGRNHHAPF